MNEPLLTQIESAMPQLSKSHRAIAEYIIKQYDKAAYMTAAKLSVSAGVSEATVVRFAKRFGFEGY
ncbi:MAG: MurR/RpiR family transcriptional regulator, partial [Clostridia bacterium]|nr:MurR/RpiR family transcriptional regulator [Clostridia bacterium]